MPALRELALRVPRGRREEALDRLLPIVPGGVRETECGSEVELAVRGDRLPALSDIARAAGVPIDALTEREVPDHWRARRLHDYRPLIIGGRVLVRPNWAPAAALAADRRQIEIVLDEAAAFGGGTHPTTYACAEILLSLTPSGGFADLGCGTGLLGILAAKLGWAPVTAVDLQPSSAAAAAGNAHRNGVELAARVGDLCAEPPPTCDAFAANVPPFVHRALAAGLPPEGPRLALLSGFGPSEALQVLTAYRAHGLYEERAIERNGWTIVLVHAK